MKLFLDMSVLLAACGSQKEASRELFRLAPLNEWTLMTTPDDSADADGLRELP